MSRFYAIATVLRGKALLRLTYTPFSNTRRWLAYISDATKYSERQPPPIAAAYPAQFLPIPRPARLNADEKQHWLSRKTPRKEFCERLPREKKRRTVGKFQWEKDCSNFLVKMAHRHVCLDTGKLQGTIWERQFWDISGFAGFDLSLKEKRGTLDFYTELREVRFSVNYTKKLIVLSHHYSKFPRRHRFYILLYV